MTYPSDKLVSFMGRVGLIQYWIKEREKIREMKERLHPSKPASGFWSGDMILNTYRFCNVRRKDDRVSAWLIKNVYEPNQDDPTLWFQCVVSRMINWPPTIAELMASPGAWPTAAGWDEDLTVKIMTDRAARGEKVWTGAYIVTAVTMEDGENKAKWLARKSWRPLWDLTNRSSHASMGNGIEAIWKSQGRTVEASLEFFKGKFGMGSFMAGQAVADMTYTKLLFACRDIDTYAPMGPGSTRGLNWLSGITTIDTIIPQRQFNAQLAHLRNYLVSEDIKLCDTSLHDIQNVMCEVDKYVRALTGRGKPRALYTPERRF